MYETRTDEWHTAWINPRVPFLGVDTERDFHPVGSSFHQTYKADKIPDVHYSHRMNLEVITLVRENHGDIICLPPHNIHKMLRLYKISRGLLKYSAAKKLKNNSVQQQQIGEQFGSAYSELVMDATG
jgi:hypothetical protein